MEKLTLFMLIPTNHVEQLAQSVINKIIPMIGELNCEQADNDCVLRINYHISQEQINKILDVCTDFGYTGCFIIAPPECDAVYDNYIELS